jgi:hypothetical protein
MIKWRRLRWAVHVAGIRRRGMCMGYWWESQRETDHWKDQAIGRLIIPKLILKR